MYLMILASAEMCLWGSPHERWMTSRIDRVLVSDTAVPMGWCV